MSDENNTEQRPSAPTVSQETSNPQTTAPEPLGDAPCCASLLHVLGPRLSRRYQPRKTVCDLDCPSHSRQQVELLGGGDGWLSSELQDFAETPEYLRKLSQKCRHSPDVDGLLSVIARWKEDGCPPPTAWLHARRWGVEDQVFYFLGLPFVEGVHYVEHNGHDFWMPNVIPAERPSAPTAEPLGDAPCSALISVLQEVGARLKDGFDTRGVPCKVKPFLYGFEIQISGVSLCIGGRGTVEKPDLCVSSCECDLDGNITGPLINPLELEIPVTSEQPCLDGLGSQRTMVGETLASGDGEQATGDTQIGVNSIDEVLSNHKEFPAQRPSAPTAEPLGDATCCASSDCSDSGVIAHLSDHNVEVLRHECYSGAQMTEYRTTDGKRPDPDSIAVRCGIVDLKSDDEWSALQDRLRSREQSKSQTSPSAEDEHEALRKIMGLQKIPCCHEAPLA